MGEAIRTQVGDEEQVIVDLVAPMLAAREVIADLAAVMAVGAAVMAEAGAGAVMAGEAMVSRCPVDHRLGASRGIQQDKR